jgi:hypothetical protein
MKAAHALGHIRALCSLGVGGEAIMPALIDAVHRLIPYHCAGFFWVDPQAQVANVYDAGAVDRRVLTLYSAEFSKHSRTAYGCGFSMAMRTLSGVHELPDWGEAFYRTDFYNIIWRSFGAQHAIQAIVREGRGPTTGALVLYRAASDQAFTAEEKRLLENLIPYIAHGLRDRQGGEFAAWRTADERGMLILNREGSVIHMCPDARKLVALAGFPRVDHTRIARDILGEAVAQSLDELRRRLTAIFVGQDAPPPMLTHANPWGRFVFRAHWMENPEGMRSDLIGVTIERYEPMAIRVWRRLSGHGLSVTQEEVALMLAQGLGRGEIARRLNVSANTATDHIRKLYPNFHSSRVDFVVNQ